MKDNSHDVTTSSSTTVDRSRLKHVPTPEQVQTLARFNGGEVCSYMLDPSVNYVPLQLTRYWRELGRHGLCFTCRDSAGYLTMEMVVTPAGRGFDLLDGRDLLLDREELLALAG